MNTKVDDIMIRSVVTTVPHKSVAHVKDIMKTKNLHSIPVVGPQNEPLGIVTAKDLIHESKPETPIKHLMTEGVFTVPQYADVSIAARMMRNHNIHHLIVTHEQQIVGIVSSFDLLKLVEDKRFVMKNPPTPGKNASKRS